MDTADGVELLTSGRAFVDLPSCRTIAVSGSDAVGWLNDLVSARVDDLVPGRARRSLLLSPTGAVLAEFTVARTEDEILLIQDPTQPSSIAELLDRYVLSSDVQLHDRTGALAIFAFPGRTSVAGVEQASRSEPSVLGTGVDLVVSADDHELVLETLEGEFTRVAQADADAFRIAAGIPAIGVDTADGDLPAECRLDGAVTYDKGCFLGQEAVARMRNLGHPRRVLVTLEAGGAVARDEPVLAGVDEAGTVTSAVRIDGRTLLFARVRWEHRDASLHTASGVRLLPRAPLR